MNKIKYSAAILITLLCGAPVIADDYAAQTNAEYVQIKGSALETLYAGAVMIGEYRQYRQETKTFRFEELHLASGITDYKEGKLSLKGKWKIVGGDKICYRYPKSSYLRGACYFTYKSDGCYYGYTLDLMSVRKAGYRPRNYAKWSTRSIKKGSGGSCAQAIG